MPEYLAPGVFVEEVERGPRPIEGVATGTAALLGETERGMSRPRLVTSYAEYARHFGGAFADGKYMPYAVRGFFENGGRRLFVCRISGDGAVAASRAVGDLTIEAAGPGNWGNRVHVRIVPSTPTTGAGFRLQVAYWAAETPDGRYPDPFDPAQARLQPVPALIEDFDNLVFDQPGSPDYFVTRIARDSVLVRVAPGGSAPPAAAFAPLANGADGGVPTAAHFRGEHVESDRCSGLSALDLDDYREVALVAAPAAAADIVNAVRTHCERSKRRFAVIDCEPGAAATSLDPRSAWDSSYAAFYYPWVYTADLVTGARRLVPPSGHVLGLYARTDTERGVWKAPANEVLRGVSDLAFPVTNGLQEVLNPRGVNVIRQFPGRGIRVWGARTLSSDAEWKYVSVRRLFIFLERSICEGSQWVVFEPNDARLWTRVKDTISQFLRAQWRSGALMGTTERQAFFVACDRTTMTQNDLDNGHLICQIGVAAVRPAEFVIFRIRLNTAEARP